MKVRRLHVFTLDELREHVREVLSACLQVNRDEVELRETTVERGGVPCGLLFSAVGPPDSQQYAVWNAPENRISFYDGFGRCISETSLTVGRDFFPRVA